jgi:2-polyprenyl-3-methyl-5-hydroxy-6-metoxy-1,4-benzoquinol methylase
MNAEEINNRKQEIIKRFGPWTAHCIHLADDLYTFDHPEMDSKLRRFLQISSDITGEPLEKLRVLDLACLEGQFGIEFALHGSSVLALEGREVNLAKARFVKEAASLDNLDLVLDDVRNLSVDRYGSFDVVLCLGILYHLDTPDVMDFVEKVSKVCKGLAIIDTHISLSNEASYTWREKVYWGSYFQEHDTCATPDEKLASVWYSLDNTRSFKFTRASLCNMLRHVGFTSVYECLNPYEYHNPKWPLAAEDDRRVITKDRVTLVAIKGQKQTVLSSPITEASPEIDRPEKPEYWEDSGMPLAPQVMKRSLWSRAGKLLPKPVKGVLRRITR